MNFTNRVFLPDGRKIYVSDDNAGDQRLEELHNEYGNLKVEVCRKEFGSTLDECEVFLKTTIRGLFE
jgi:hypothetical protein